MTKNMPSGRGKVKNVSAKVLKELVEKKEDEFAESVIEAVRARPQLYNKKLADYKDNGKKHRNFLEIAQELECTVDDVTKVWTKLRNDFRIERKARQNPSGAGVSKKRKAFKFYDTMLFLDEHVQMRKTRTTLGKYSDESDPEYAIPVEGEGEMFLQNSQDVDEGESQEYIVLNTQSTAFGETEMEVNDEELIALLQNNAKKRLTWGNASDGDDDETQYSPARNLRPRSSMQLSPVIVTPQKAATPNRPKPTTTAQAKAHMEVKPKLDQASTSKQTQVHASQQIGKPERNNAQSTSKSQPHEVSQNAGHHLAPHLPILSPSKEYKERAKQAKQSRNSTDAEISKVLMETASAVQAVAKRSAKISMCEDRQSDAGPMEIALGQAITQKLSALPTLKLRQEWRKKFSSLLDELELVLEDA